MPRQFDDSNKTLISVAMAAYNGSAFIDAQIESILNQTHTNIELIICDDCSLDETVKIVCKYQNDTRVKPYFNEINVGYKMNFEKAIGLCSGNYIALADQDDIWNPRKLELLLKHISDHDLIHSDAVIIDDRGAVIDTSYSRYSSKSLICTARNILFNGSVTGCTCMFNSRITGQILPFPSGDYAHDRWIALVSSIGNGVHYLDLPLIKYRQHSNNISGASKFQFDFTSMVMSVLDTERHSGILQHYSFACSVKNRFPKANIKLCSDLELACNLHDSIKLGHFFNFLKYSFYAIDSIDVGSSIFVRIFKLINLCKITLVNKYKND
jgi:glycosyltransferase involved in cell wall biosynthesis